MVKLIKTEKPTKWEIERGVGILFSLKIIVNVLYALLLFEIFMILPRPDDPELNYLSLVEIYNEHSIKLVVIIVGLILILSYWIKPINNWVTLLEVHPSMPH